MDSKQLVKIFNTLSNPTRLEIYRCILSEACDCDLTAEELSGNCVTRISQKLKINQPTVSNHIKELVNAGLIIIEKRGRTTYLFGTSDSSKFLNNFSDFVDKKVKAASGCNTKNDK